MPPFTLLLFLFQRLILLKKNVALSLSFNEFVNLEPNTTPICKIIGKIDFFFLTFNYPKRKFPTYGKL